MEVLILGAGASKPAGYPLASELMPTIQSDIEESRDAMLRAAWQDWEKTKKAASGPLLLLVEDPNPEVMLSVLDLCRLSSSAEIKQTFRPEWRDKIGGLALSDDIPAEAFTSLATKWLHEADVARHRLLSCLIAYFYYRHHVDASSPATHREYLKDQLSKLRHGDVVITTNWDTLTERTLLEAGLWSPRDGYGFIRNLTGMFGEEISSRLTEPVVSLNWWKSYKASAAVERFYYQPTMQPPLIYYRS